MAQKSLKLNYIYNVSYQVLTLITPLITTPYLSRVLNPAGIGTYSNTAANVSYFVMLATLGTAFYGNREISYLQNDRNQRTTVFWEIEILKILSTVVSVICYGVFLCFCQPRNFALYLVQVISILSAAADVTWLLQGLEEFGKVVGRNFIFRIFNIAFIFLFIKRKEDLFLYIAGLVIMEFLANLSIWLYLPKYVDRPRLSTLHPVRHLKPTVALFIPTVAASIYTIFDKTMLGLFTDTSLENGYYEQALKLSKTVLTLVTALGTVMIPRIGMYFSNNKTDKVKELLLESYHFVWFLGLPLCLGLIGISNNFVPWFYGDGYEKVAYLLPILGLLIPIIGISNVTGMQYLITTKREQLVTRTVTIGAVVNFVLNLILIPHFYSIGASVASVIAELTITTVQLYYIRTELSVRTIIKASGTYLFASFVMLVLLVIENHFFTPSILHTCIMIITGGALYFAILLLCRDPFLLGQFTHFRKQK